MTRDWYPIERQHKQVTLCDVYMCKSISCNDIVRALAGMGLYEWKVYMSHVFSDAVLKAFEHRKTTADITMMFSCDLVGINDEGNHTKEQKDICAILKEKLFYTVSETNEELIVALKWNEIKRKGIQQ